MQLVVHFDLRGTIQATALTIFMSASLPFWQLRQNALAQHHAHPSGLP